MPSLDDINKYINENIIKGLFDKKLAEQFYKQVLKDRTDQNIIFDYRDGKEDAILYINQLLIINNNFLNSKEWLLFQDDNDIRAFIFVHQCRKINVARDGSVINTLIMYVENKNWQALFQNYVFYKALEALINHQERIIKTIKTVKKYEWLHKNSFKQQLQINKDNCSICSNVVIEDGSTTDCGHNFHKKCIDNMCRKVFKKEVPNAKIRCPSCGYLIFINCYRNSYCIRNYY
jgi:rubrerythrin